jgi:hypothetical protein
MMTDYEKQAADFLGARGLHFAALQAREQAAPPWAKVGEDHGTKYRITITRSKTGASISFDFWGSIKDCEDGTKPTAYDVLACISGDANAPETFEDWCGDYGYDTDSRAAYATWERCKAFAAKLQHFFSADDLAALSQIN